MARYNVRDLLGHFVRPTSARGKMCPHACCRNKRVHPANMPVILPSRLLRRASDEDLAQHYSDVSGKDTPEAEAAQYQVMYEMDRRDKVTERREQAQERRRHRYTARKIERDELVEYYYLRAEQATKGNMLNARGRASGINERTLFRGPSRRAYKYASEELLNHWREVERPTEAMLQGQDTRYQGAA